MFIFVSEFLKLSRVKLEISAVKELLNSVRDPLTGQPITTAERIRKLEVEDQEVRLTLLYTKALSPEQKSALNFACMNAINAEFPQARVHVHLETQLNPGEQERSVLPQIRNIIAVASGKGGVGKSTVSSTLALSLFQQGYRTGIIDADLYGPSIPTMFGLSGQRPKLVDVLGKPKIVPLDKDGLKIMSIGFIVEADQAVVLRGPRLAGIIKQFIEECIWPELDYLVIDLPPGTGDIQLTLVQTLPLTGVIMVTTPQKVAVIDAVKAMNMFRLPSIKVPILGVIENMSWFSPPDDPNKKYYIFGQGGGTELAHSAESKLLGEVPLIESIRSSGDSGLPSVGGASVALKEIWNNITDQVVQAVELRNMADATRIVKIKG
jgi:ATP-binding protein involved in chromosome partitioning